MKRSGETRPTPMSLRDMATIFAGLVLLFSSCSKPQPAPISQNGTDEQPNTGDDRLLPPPVGVKVPADDEEPRVVSVPRDGKDELPPIVDWPGDPPGGSKNAPASQARHSLSRVEVMERFRTRASPAEIHEFDKMAASRDPVIVDRATQSVLLLLTNDELFAIGITQSHQPGHIDWALAFSSAFGEDAKAIRGALYKAGIGYVGSSSRRRAGWYVNREQFFAARRALLEIPDLKSLGIHVVEPQFRLP
jgi:hypothetical protein